MNLDSFKEELFDLFYQNQFKLIFHRLKKSLHSDSELFNDFLMLGRRYNEVADKAMASLINSEEGNLNFNQIGNALLNFIKKIQPEHLKQFDTDSSLSINNPILLYPNDQFAPSPLIKMFGQLNFSGIQLFSEDDPSDYTAFDIVIFDNRHLPILYSKDDIDKKPASDQEKVQARIRQMEAVLTQSTSPIIHLGNQLFWINAHRNRVHAANSQFALYARTKEVIDFVNAYRV